MSDILKFSRLSLLLKNHLVEHRQKYLYYMAGMFFIGLIVFVLLLSFNNFYDNYSNVRSLLSKEHHTTSWETAQVIIYLSGLAIFAVIFSSVSFVNFNNKGEAIFYLIKPASQFEKWLTEIIVHVFLFFFAYTLIFYLLDIPATIFVRSMEYDHYLQDSKTWTPVLKQTNYFNPSSFFHFGTFREDVLIAYPICISVYFTGVAFFMYGAVLFNRFSFFKTLIFGFVTAMVYVFYTFNIFDAFTKNTLPDDWVFYSLDKAKRYGETFSYEVRLPEYWNWIAIFGLMILVPVVLLICSYWKLKEKEV